MLGLVLDVVDGVVFHREVIGLHFPGGGVDAVGLDQAVQVVVLEVLAALAAEFVASGDRGAVVQAQTLRPTRSSRGDNERPRCPDPVVLRS